MAESLAAFARFVMLIFMQSDFTVGNYILDVGDLNVQ